MTDREFKKHMQDLIKVFGTSEYENRMQYIYEIVSDLPENYFAWIIKHFILTKSVKYPPLPEEFREAAELQRKHIREKDSQKEVFKIAELEPTGEALTDILSKFGASNLYEVIKKNPKI